MDELITADPVLVIWDVSHVKVWTRIGKIGMQIRHRALDPIDSVDHALESEVSLD
jgi:hypothetical protein